MDQTIESLAEECRKVIQANQDCYVAQWILQNPKEKVDDYVLVHRRIDESSKFGYMFYMVSKDAIQ